VRAAYNKAQRLPERGKMMQAWANYLDALREGAHVVPIRRFADSASSVTCIEFPGPTEPAHLSCVSHRDTL
jgi:hypothetical protein